MASSWGLPTPPPSVSPDRGESNRTTSWLLDTRSLWCGSDIKSAQGASEALALISPEEQKRCMTKLYISDAKMSLGSALLKRLWISQTLNIPWKEVQLGRRGDPKHGKPCAVDDNGNPIPGIDFNISHQNGLVTLVGYDGRAKRRPGPEDYISTPQAVDVTVGTDIVCVNERDDYASIDAEGLDGWVDIYDSIFSDEERWHMKYDVDYITLLDGTTLTNHDIGRHDRCISRNQSLDVITPVGRKLSFSSDHLIDAKLRRFYAYFCYKESYIKLSGEALLAPWIKRCEFFNVRSPKPGTPARCSTHGVWGEQVDDVEVHLHGTEVNNVRMVLQAFEEDFMIGTAVQGDIKGIEIAKFEQLDLDTQIMQYAEENLYA